MNVLITGGAGYIGSHLADRLLAEGHRVAVLDNLSTGRRANIAHNLRHSQFEWVEGDVRNAPGVAELVARSDAVFHLAAVVGVANVVRDPLACIQVNVEGTESVLSAAFAHRRRVTFASSSEIYGKSASLPFREDDDRLLGTTWTPRWAYAVSKALDEHLCFAYAARGLEISVVRYFNSYGQRIDPRGCGSVVARFITQALAGEPMTVYGDGNQTRCFTFVTDTVEGTIRAGTRTEAMGEAFNIGSDREITVLELVEQIRALAGSSSPVVHLPYEEVFGGNFEEAARRRPAIDKARRLLGFEPAVSLEEGLKETIRWFAEETSPR
jgi:UDP-glucose 4-epimerase